MIRGLHIVTVGGMSLLAAAGCLERKELIRIGADGRIRMELHYEGEEQDWYTLDAMPSKESGWNVHVETRKENDKKTRTLTAVRDFPPGSKLPDSYAADAHSQAVALHFPTEFWTEARDDGTYAHFKRVYSPRPWAYVDFWNRNILDDDMKKLSEKPAEELTPDDRARLIRAFGDMEAMKLCELTRAALRELEPNLAQDKRLLAHRAILDTYSGGVDSVLQSIESLDEEKRDSVLSQKAEELRAKATKEVELVLQKHAAFDRDKLVAYRDAFRRAMETYDVTQQVGPHVFRIEIQMPGRIVAHNADKITDDNTAIWDFPGEAFRDRPYELMISSKLESK